MNKYRNIITEVDGIRFSNRKEADYYGVLKMFKLAGEIKDFTTQETYRLCINSVEVCKYISDFKIIHYNGLFEVIDVKSEITRKNPVYRIKVKLMKAIHGITIIEK